MGHVGDGHVPEISFLELLRNKWIILYQNPSCHDISFPTYWTILGGDTSSVKSARAATGSRYPNNERPLLIAPSKSRCQPRKESMYATQLIQLLDISQCTDVLRTSSNQVQVLRYSALLAGLFYGFSHQRTITSNNAAAHAQAEYQHKLDLIQKAKLEWAKKSLPPQSKTASGDGM